MTTCEICGGPLYFKDRVHQARWCLQCASKIGIHRIHDARPREVRSGEGSARSSTKIFIFDPIVSAIQATARADVGVEIDSDAIYAALKTDRDAGLSDPTLEEMEFLVQGNDEGHPPDELCDRHPALDDLLTRVMT